MLYYWFIQNIEKSRKFKKLKYQEKRLENLEL